MSEYFFDNMDCHPNNSSRIFAIGREAAEKFRAHCIGGIVPRPDLVRVMRLASCHSAFLVMHVQPPPSGTVIVLSEAFSLEQLLAAVLLEYRLLHPDDPDLRGVPTSLIWLMTPHSTGARTMQDKLSLRSTLAERLQLLRNYLFDAGEADTPIIGVTYQT